MPPVEVVALFSGSCEADKISRAVHWYKNSKLELLTLWPTEELKSTELEIRSGVVGLIFPSSKVSSDTIKLLLAEYVTVTQRVVTRDAFETVMQNW